MNGADDPVTDLKTGCLIPFARSWMLVGCVIILAAIVTLRARDGTWFFVILGGSMPVFWLFERSQKTKRARERKALDRLLGIDRR